MDLPGPVVDFFTSTFWTSPWGQPSIGVVYILLGFMGSRFFQKHDMKRERTIAEYDRHTERIEQFAVDARAAYERLRKFQNAYVNEQQARYNKNEEQAERYDKEGTRLAEKLNADLSNLESSLRELSVKVPELADKAKAICDDIAKEYELTYEIFSITSSEDEERFMAPFEAEMRKRKGLPPIQGRMERLKTRLNPRN